MEDAFNLSSPKAEPEPPLVVPPAPPSSHKSVADALAHLTKLKEEALTYVGKDNMNPYLWLEKRRVEYLLRKLSKDPTTEDVEEAFNITAEEPLTALFITDYEAPAPPPPRRSSPYR